MISIAVHIGLKAVRVSFLILLCDFCCAQYKCTHDSVITTLATIRDFRLARENLYVADVSDSKGKTVKAHM